MTEISTRNCSSLGDQFLETLYNGLSEPIIGIEPSSGRILHWNNGAAITFGLQAEDAVGKNFNFLCADQESFHSFFANLVSEVRKHGSWQALPRLYRHDSADIYAGITAILAPQRGTLGESITLIFHKRARTPLLQEIADVANEASSVADALNVTLDKLCKETLSRHLETTLLIGHVYRVMTTDATSSADYWYLSNPKTLTSIRAASDAIRSDQSGGLIGRVLASHKLEWVGDFADDKTDPRAEAAGKAGLKTAIALPILAGGDVVAVMELFTSETLTPEAPLLEALSQTGVALGRIVEQKLTWERLRQSELLAAIGLMAAKLAREISNPLNGMYTSTQLLEYLCKGAKGYTEDIIPSIVKGFKQEVDRLRSLLSEFRTLSAPMTFDFELVDVSEIAHEVANLEGSLYARQAITIKLDFPSDLPKVTVDREKIKQALLNLCQNAADAMPLGGTLTIRAYKFWQAICLEVQDTGSGVPVGINIFEIFTTTKGGGYGLGLPIVQQIIAGHRGSVTFTSESGKGTIFRLTLPITAKS